MATRISSNPGAEPLNAHGPYGGTADVAGVSASRLRARSPSDTALPGAAHTQM
jgi:hypothetical protein